jgi:hypothetical protein
MINRLAIAMVALVALAPPVWAQSDPGLVLHQVPSPAQWNGYFAAKQDYAGSTFVSVTSNGAKCDGATNDTAAIQATITAYAGKRPVYVPATGAACMVGQLNVPSGTHLTIDGTLKLVPLTNTIMLQLVSGASYVTIDGTGTLDGNASAQTAGSFSCGVYNVGSVSWVWLRHYTATNFRVCATGLNNATHAWMSNLILTNSGNSVAFINSTDCWADHLYINNTADEGFAFYGANNSCGITNSTVTGSTVGAGISLLNDVGAPNPSTNILIQGNQLYGNNFSGVTVDTGTGGSGNHTNVSVIGNRIYGNNLGNHPGEGGVALFHTTGAVVSGNIISKDGGGSNGAIGINLGSGSTKINVTGNLIFDEGVGSTLGVGIGLGGSNTNAIISDNTIYDDQGTKTMAFGLNGTAAVQTFLVGNNITGTIGPANNVTNQPDTVSGVSCNSAAPTSSFITLFGIVTHC